MPIKVKAMVAALAVGVLIWADKSLQETLTKEA